MCYLVAMLLVTETYRKFILNMRHYGLILFPQQYNEMKNLPDCSCFFLIDCLFGFGVGFFLALGLFCLLDSR